jgi:hypothetical protein
MIHCNLRIYEFIFINYILALTHYLYKLSSSTTERGLPTGHLKDKEMVKTGAIESNVNLVLPPTQEAG